ncbi:hypothetical protein ACA30_13450 [Virgibacillus soli]|nr:hypothetical protein ACA30_13450 [Virgibacillus soli]
MSKGPQFFQTIRGRNFYEKDIPNLVSSLDKLAEETKRENDLKERELDLMERSIELKESSELVALTKITFAIERLAMIQDELFDYQKKQSLVLEELATLKKEKGI